MITNEKAKEFAEELIRETVGHFVKRESEHYLALSPKELESHYEFVCYGEYIEGEDWCEVRSKLMDMLEKYNRTLNWG